MSSGSNRDPTSSHESPAGYASLRKPLIVNHPKNPIDLASVLNLEEDLPIPESVGTLHVEIVKSALDMFRHLLVNGIHKITPPAKWFPQPRCIAG